ncbi:IS1182 family transposase [Candidatus Pollutiaquabacter sp.]|uniref:IS1182 family transposase n=1 Tax=Candidatus Pollutiaquabacter sp. TaxID=3416354 RepID=UPI003CA1598C|nr:IS1182 family transposase [Bacteroidota bacterium]
MKYLTGFDRRQATLFPTCIDDLIPEDAEVRVIDLFVDALPLKDLGFLEKAPVEEGRPMYHPADLFKLYVYGYLNRIRTSRLLARECQRNIELLWLLKGLQPCFRTIAGFRSENPQLFRNAFTHFVRQLNRKGLTGKTLVALDSSKFRAVNSKKNNFNQKKIDRQLEYIDTKIQSYIEELNAGDLDEAQQEAVGEKLKKQKAQRRKYKRIEKQLAATGQDQVSTTDPDARSMILHGSVIEVAYNVQTVADSANKLVLEYEVTNQNDRKALLPMAQKTKSICDTEAVAVLADKGYHNGEQLAACQREDIYTYVAYQEVPRSNPVPTPEFYGERFRYNPKKDQYVCPQGYILKTTGQWYNKKYEKSVTRVKHYKTTACNNCEVRHLCTRNPNGRVIERSVHAEAVERNNRRVRENSSVYTLRQQIIEHIFGTIKRQWGYDHILLKGLRKNEGEFGLIYLIYNFRRVINILGLPKLKKWLRKLLFSIFTDRALRNCWQQLNYPGCRFGPINAQVA